MKRWIYSSDYIPDMTERYPEGMRSYVDDYEAPMWETLRNVVDYIKSRYAERDINEIKVYSNMGKCILVTDTLDDVLQSFGGQLSRFCRDTRVDEETGLVEIFLL